MANEPMYGGPEPYQGQGSTPTQSDSGYEQYPQYPAGYPSTPPQYPQATPAGAPAFSGYYPGPMAQSTNGMAIASLVCSITSFVFAPLIGAILGVIFGHIALSQLKVSQEQGHGMAVAGLVIGYIHLGLAVLALLFFIVFFIILAASQR